MKRQLTPLRWFCAVAILLVVLAGGSGFLWLQRSLPQSAGIVHVTGLSASVEVLRDRDGVPHISATTDADALFGLGYVHAQDRLWQMEWQRRVATGRLSEILGASALPSDRLMRTLGLNQAAQSAWQQFGSETQQLVQSYVAGINQFIATHQGAQLPLEFQSLGIAPEPWQPSDTLVLAKLLAWEQDDSWQTELLRQSLNSRLGAERAAALLPSYPSDGPLILPSDDSEPVTQISAPTAACDACVIDSTALLSSVQQARRLSGGLQAISSGWVLGGAFTSSGKPLLANDLLLGAPTNTLWYLAHIKGYRFDAIGATLPGIPAIISGHNQRVAWGMIGAGSDTQDLFVERVDLQQNTAEYQGQPEPLQLRSETIRVRGQADETLTVRSSRHGPLLLEGEQSLALRWSALDGDDRTIEALLGLLRVRDWRDFTDTLDTYKAPVQRILFADIKNNIGMVTAGALPIRAAGDGSLPVAGWTAAAEWQGYQPFDELPRVRNPESGMIIATSQQPAMPQETTVIGTTYRAERLNALLEASSGVSVAEMAQVQDDQRSLQARALLPVLLQATTDDPQAQQAITLLRDWDGTIAADSAQAAIYEAWYSALPQRLFADELGDDLWQLYRGQTDAIALQLSQVLLQGDTAWCDDITTTATEDCATMLGAALVDGLARMRVAQGSADLSTWRWDRAHQAVFEHPLFGATPILQTVANRRVPLAGEAQTVQVAPFEPEQYQTMQPAVYRQVIDLLNLENSQFIQSFGQSGQIQSPQYANLLRRWQQRALIPMRFEKNAINAAAAGRLMLEPES